MTECTTEAHDTPKPGKRPLQVWVCAAIMACSIVSGIPRLFDGTLSTFVAMTALLMVLVGFVRRERWAYWAAVALTVLVLGMSTVVLPAILPQEELASIPFSRRLVGAMRNALLLVMLAMSYRWFNPKRTSPVDADTRLGSKL